MIPTRIIGISVILLSIGAACVFIWQCYQIALSVHSLTRLFEVEPPEGYAYWESVLFWRRLGYTAPWVLVSILFVAFPVCGVLRSYGRFFEKRWLDITLFIVSLLLLLPAVYSAVAAYPYRMDYVHSYFLAVPPFAFAFCLWVFGLCIFGFEDKNKSNKSVDPIHSLRSFLGHR
jgi:hypothetical protein